MLNLEKLLRRTFPNRKDSADFVQLTNLTAGHWKSGPDKGFAYIAAHAHSTDHKDPTKHVTAITFIDNKLNVKVSCSCGDNTFRWEAANWLQDASDIEYSNGDMPDITNPARIPGLCKHLVALSRVAMERIKPKVKKA